jgi:hypothetical protein
MFIDDNAVKNHKKYLLVINSAKNFSTVVLIFNVDIFIFIFILYNTFVKKLICLSIKKGVKYKMYQLGLCELHCWKLHGGDKNLGHYLLISTFPDFNSGDSDASSDTSSDASSDTSSDGDTTSENILEVAQYHNEYYNVSNATHAFIRNYANMIKSSNYIKPEIIRVVILETGESVAIIKTVWIRIFQRRWRSRFAKRVAFLKNIHNINASRLTGRYPRFISYAF